MPYMPTLRKKLKENKHIITRILLIVLILISTLNSVINLTPKVPKYMKPFYQENIVEYRDLEFVSTRYQLLYELCEQKYFFRVEGDTVKVINIQHQMDSVKESVDMMFSVYMNK